MSKTCPPVEIVPFASLSGLLAATDGFGIFINFGHIRMHVGSILPMYDGTFMLRVGLLDQEHAPGFRSGEIELLCQTPEVAASKARAFLEESYVDVS